LATVLSTYDAIKNFPKVGVIPNLRFWLKLEEWRKRDLEIKNKIELKKQQVDKLPWRDCFDFEKVIIKSLIEKTDGYFKIQTYQEFLNRIQQPVFEQEIEQARRRAEETGITTDSDSVWGKYHRTTEYVWEKDHRGIWIQSERPHRRSDVFWSILDGNRYFFKNIRNDGSEYVPQDPCNHFFEGSPVHKRNNSIFKIRLKYLNEHKTHSANYENRGQYYYKNPKAYKQFLKQVEQKELVRKAEVKQTRKEVYDPVDGVYHYNVSLLKRNTNSRHYKAADDPDICNNYFYNEETGNYEILREDEL
jgi:hypothetical protein